MATLFLIHFILGDLTVKSMQKINHRMPACIVTLKASTTAIQATVDEYSRRSVVWSIHSYDSIQENKQANKRRHKKPSSVLTLTPIFKEQSQQRCNLETSLSLQFEKLSLE